jgi:GDP-L-fucose synthase
MNFKSRIFIAGSNGMVGSAIWRNLKSKGYTNLIEKSSKELDLRNQAQVEEFFVKEKPEFIFLAAAKVGGILANDTYRAEFIYDNLMIQNNLIHQSYVQGIKKILFLGSSCIYPRDCPQPMKEEYLLTGELEQTNEPYAIAKIAGIKMCENYNRQYGTNFISVMPTNLYGPGDNYNLETSHVLPALFRKFYLGKKLEDRNWGAIRSDLNKMPINRTNGTSSKDEILNILKSNGIFYKEGLKKSSINVVIWGTGEPLREFLHVNDLARACIFLMETDPNKLSPSADIISPLFNIGSGEEIAIYDLAVLIKDIIGFKGGIVFDKSKPDGTMKKLLDTSKLNKLGWKHSLELKQGIKAIAQSRYSLNNE